MSLPTPYYQDSAVTLFHGDSAVLLEDVAGIDLCVTSPPYDALRDYGGQKWNFEDVAYWTERALKAGGILVWIVGDQASDWSESMTSFHQALHFHGLGMGLLDTMIYEKENVAFERHGHRTYAQNFEFMFVFSKGRPKAFNPIRDKKNVRHGETLTGTVRKPEGHMVQSHSYGREIREFGIRGNVWRYAVGRGHTTEDIYAHAHPAMMPEALAKDHIISWSDAGDTILDPHAGAGTVLKAAKQLGRKAIGIEIEERYCEIAAKRMSQEVFDFSETRA